jgi:hypothetical protein
VNDIEDVGTAGVVRVAAARFANLSGGTGRGWVSFGN